MMRSAGRAARYSPLSIPFFVLLFGIRAAGSPDATPARSIVEDPQGRPIPGAKIAILTASGLPLAQATADERGEFRIGDLPKGIHIIEVRASNFQTYRAAWGSPSLPSSEIRRIVLPLGQLYHQVTVTASPGSARDLADAEKPTTVISGETLRTRSHPTIGNALADAARVPLFTALPGFAALHVRARVRVTEGASLSLGLLNLTDRNYRHHGSGVDAPGRSLLLTWEWSF